MSAVASELFGIFRTAMPHWSDNKEEGGLRKKQLKPQLSFSETVSSPFKSVVSRLPIPQYFRGDEDKETLQFTFRGNEYDIDLTEAYATSPRKGWTTAAVAWWDNRGDADIKPKELNRPWVMAAFHLGRGAGRVIDHAWVAHKRHISAWVFIWFANMSAHKYISTLVVGSAAVASFVASENDVTERIEKNQWIKEGPGKTVWAGVKTTAAFSRTVRIALNTDRTALGFVSGLLVLRALSPAAFGSVPGLSILTLSLTIFASFSTGDYFGRDGLTIPQQDQAQGSGQLDER